MAKIRLICVSNYTGTAEHVGGPPEVTYHTFDVELPDAVAEWLSQADRHNARFVQGVEVAGLAAALTKAGGQ